MQRAIPTHVGAFSLRSALMGIVATICSWQSRDEERQNLATLDDRLLSDIGLTRGQVQAEVRKPFWRP